MTYVYAISDFKFFHWNFLHRNYKNSLVMLKTKKFSVEYENQWGTVTDFRLHMLNAGLRQTVVSSQNCNHPQQAISWIHKRSKEHFNPNTRCQITCFYFTQGCCILKFTPPLFSPKKSKNIINEAKQKQVCFMYKICQFCKLNFHLLIICNVTWLPVVTGVLTE